MAWTGLDWVPKGLRAWLWMDIHPDIMTNFRSILFHSSNFDVCSSFKNLFAVNVNAESQDVALAKTQVGNV